MCHLKMQRITQSLLQGFGDSRGGKHYPPLLRQPQGQG